MTTAMGKRRQDPKELRVRNDFYKLGGKLPVENKKAGARSGSEV